MPKKPGVDMALNYEQRLSFESRTKNIDHNSINQSYMPVVRPQEANKCCHLVVSQCLIFARQTCSLILSPCFELNPGGASKFVTPGLGQPRGELSRPPEG